MMVARSLSCMAPAKISARRSRTLIDEYYHRYLLIGTLAIARIILARRLAALGIENQFLLRQELVCHVHSSCEITARVVAQVDTEILESLLRELCQGDEHLWIGVLAEVLDADISRVVIEHIGCGDALGRYLATGDGEGLHLLAAIAHDANLHLRILRTLQSVHRFLVGDNLAHERLAIYGYNLVACQTIQPFRLVRSESHSAHGWCPGG